MKKIFVLLCALFALAACATEATDETTEVAQNGKTIKLALTINRTDVFADEPGTKATVKDKWADGDVVFVFFNGVAAPKYLELKYSSSNRNWTATLMNDLTADDLGTSGTMTAVYLPYGSGTVVTSSKGDFSFEPMYEGIPLLCESAAYTYGTEGLGGTLNLKAPTGDCARNENERYIHFDISGYDATHTYTLYQDYVRPIVITGVLNGGVSIQTADGGTAIPGYVDAANSIVSFSGILKAEAVASAVDYQFSINDETASVLYTRDAGTKTVSQSMYIGIGQISNSPWIATEYVDLGLTASDGSRLFWATKNLGATAEQGEGSFGNFYAWSETTGYPLTGAFKNYSCSHEFSTAPTVPDLVDNYYLPLENDPAHVALGGLWRTPTADDFDLLSNRQMTTWSFDRAIGTVTHEYVDMGNHLGWAMYNLGASSHTDWGSFYAWGETVPKDFYSQTGTYGYIGDPSLDPATAVWGAPWRTPTQAEMELLFSSSSADYRNYWSANSYGISNYNGMIVLTEEGNKAGYGKQIFFPAAGNGWDDENPVDRYTNGFYWVSDAYNNNYHIALNIYDNDYVFRFFKYWVGCSIRPVLDLGSTNAGLRFSGLQTDYTDKTLFLPAAGYVNGSNAEGQGFYSYYWTSKISPVSGSGNAVRSGASAYYPSVWGQGSTELMQCGLPVRPVFSLPY